LAQHLQVRLVAADREVWTGEARMVMARTTDGDIGVLPGHTPTLGLLVNGLVRIRQEHGDVVEAAVHGGFLSIADDDVAILAESAELAQEIDVDRAKRSLEEARRAVEGDEDALGAAERAQTRLRVAGVGL
jgi:F-type H+-transporting ATPase subunit epsilon